MSEKGPAVKRYAYLLISLCCLLLTLRCGNPGIQDIRALSPAEADSLIAANRGNSDFIMLDIRRQEEFDYARITGAVSFDLMTGTFPKKLNRLDKTKTYLLYCNEDTRSPEALELMKDKGFTAAYRIEGGLTAWALAGYPVERAKTEP